MKQKLLLSVCVLSFLTVGCRDNISGLDALTDPSVKPRVIFAGIIQASSSDFFDSYILLRFNKIMNAASVRAAVAIESPSGDLLADNQRFTSIGGDIYYVYAMDTSGLSYSFSWAKLGQQFILRVDTTAYDVNGNRLKPTYQTILMPEEYFRVRDIWPRNASLHVAGTSNILILFNSPVTTSVISSISIDPTISGNWQVSYDSTQLRFSLRNAVPSTQYNVNVATSANDRLGNPLHETFSSWFNTDRLRVNVNNISTTIVDTNTFVGVYANFYLDTASVRNAFSLTPPIPGTLSITDGGFDLKFFPMDGFRQNTTYTLILSTQLRTVSGVNLPSAYSFTFATVPFSVLTTYPSGGATNVPRDLSSIYVTSNAILDPASVQPAFNVSPPIQGTLLSFGEIFYLNITSLLSANTTYTVVLSTTLRSAGGTTLPAPFTFSFTTGN